MIHTLQDEFVIETAANPRFGDASTTEVTRSETVQHLHGYYRCIGGDQGDLLFNGYSIVGGKTVLCDPAVNAFGMGEGRFDNGSDWTEDDWMSLARNIFDESFASIGIETVEHN